MFFGGDDEELDFSSSTGKSKLASLFDMDRAASQGGNESLTYTAPKEPKKRPDAAGQSTAAPAAPAVLCAGIAFAYKFKDEKYASEGKLGVAVIGNHANSDYKLLLYITREKPVTFAKITPTFLFMVQPNNYVSFYDDSRQSWSLMFESDAVLVQFAKQVALSKFFSSTSAKGDLVITQDLSPGEGNSLEAGDNIEIKYSGWQLENNAIGSMFDNGQLFRFRIGKQKGIRAWEEGVVGMKKNGKRLLVCTPSFATGGEIKAGKFPSSIPLVFEVEVVRVKFGRERTDDASVPSVPVSVPQVTIDDKDDDREDGVRAKSKSLTDQMAQQSAKTDKAKLISRMAKMGQPMLPVVVPHQTDNIEAESPSPSPNPRPEVPTKPAQHGTSVHPGASAMPAAAPVNVMPESFYVPPSMTSLGHMMGQQPLQGPASVAAGAAGMMPASAGQLSVYHSQVPLPFQAMMGYPPPVMSAAQPFGNLYPPSQVYPVPPPQPPPVSQQSMSDTSVPMMLMETRNQNTEVRVSLSRVSDKVDRIAEKLDQLNSRQSSAVSLANSMPTMEVGMLVSNIERIVMENERLKKENFEKSSRVDEQNVKIAQLLQRNQLYVEQSNAFLEQRNDSYKNTASQSQARVQTLEQEKVQLATELSVTTSQLASCQLEIVSLKKHEGELKQQLDKLLTSDIQGREDISSMRLRLAEQDQKLEHLGAQLKEEQQDKRFLIKQNEDLKESLKDITMERDNLDKNLNEKKRKAAEEITRVETEMKEMQTNFEAELTTLKNRLKMERNSTELTSAQKLTQIEEDLNREWKEKSDRLLSSAQEKHQRELVEVNNEKAWLQERLDSVETKLAEFKALRSVQEQEKDGLQEQLEQLRIWKDKYENLRLQATSMKDRYEQRLKELEAERNAADDEREKAEQERDKAVDKARRLQIQVSSQPPGGSTGTENTRGIVVAEVKKIMNTVYRKLRQEFAPDGTYQGSDIQAVILENVKMITLEMVQNKEPADDVRGGAPSAAMEKTSSTTREENLVAQTVPLSTEAPPASASEPNAVLSDSGTDQSSLALKEESASPETSTVESADQESTKSSPVNVTSAAGAHGTNIPSASDAGINHFQGLSENADAVKIHNATEPSDDPDAVKTTAMDDKPNETQEVVQELLEPQNIRAVNVTEEHFSENLGDKTVVEGDDDSFESFESDDREEEPDKLEGKTLEQESVVEKMDETPEAQPAVERQSPREKVVNDFVETSRDSRSPPLDATPKVILNEEMPINGSGDVKREEISTVVAAEDEELFGAVDRQDSVSKLTELDSSLTTVVDPLRAVEREEARGDVVPVKVEKDIPLFGDDDDTESDTPSQVRKNPAPKNSSLFGDLDEEDDDGLFSFASKSLPTESKAPATGSRPSSGTAKQKPSSDQNKLNAKPKRNESDDDLATKPPPLPLFGDSDDDKDLDWLS